MIQFNLTKSSGIILRYQSFWIELHYSEYNKRYCLNILPGFTIWWIDKNGNKPQNTL